MRIAIGSSSATVQAASCSDRLKAVQSMASCQAIKTSAPTKPLASSTARALRPAHEIGERLGIAAKRP